MLAKENLVEDEGIGEDVPFTLFGWQDSRLIVVAQLHHSLMKEDHTQRLARVYFCASMFRMGWAVNALTFMAEAYCSDNPEETAGYPLDNLFASGNKSVSECITLTHAEGRDVSLVLVPYKIGLGRKVDWSLPVHQKEAKGLRDSVYPQLLLECLALDVKDMPEDTEMFYEHLIDGLTAKGFSVDFLSN